MFASITCIGFLYNILQLICMSEVTYSSPEPRGHLQRIGKHMHPVGEIEERRTFPTPREMFDKYLTASKPVIFRNILQKGMMPAYNLWTDSYLREYYANEEIFTEVGKKENRDGDMKRMKMSEFLDRYESEDIYMVSDASENMTKEINMPSMFTCGGYQERVQSVILWFSSGGTKSVLHNDGLDNINCLIDGQKYIVLIDKKHKDDVEADGWRTDGAYSEVDVEHVDLYKFPKLRNIPWYEVTMKKGDCLFIPFKWYHHVDSKVGRNFAINIWLRHMNEFNDTNCNEKVQQQDTFIPVSLFQNLKTKDPIALRDFLFAETEHLPELTVEFFETTMNVPEEMSEESAEQLYSMLDHNKDGIVSRNELDIANYEEMIKRFPELRNIMDENESSFYDDESEQCESEQWENSITNMMEETSKLPDENPDSLHNNHITNKESRIFRNSEKPNDNKRDEL